MGKDAPGSMGAAGSWHVRSEQSKDLTAFLWGIQVLQAFSSLGIFLCTENDDLLIIRTSALWAVLEKHQILSCNRPPPLFPLDYPEACLHLS